MKRKILLMMTLACCMMAGAEKVEVKTLRVSGPHRIATPLFTTAKDVNGKDFDENEVIWATHIDRSLWTSASESTDSIIKGRGIYLLGGTIENTGFAKVTVNVRSKGRNAIYVDDAERSRDVELVPGRHNVVIKLMETDDEADTVRVWIESEQAGALKINSREKRYWTLKDLMNGERLKGMALSASGRFVLQHRQTTRTSTQSEWSRDIMDTSNGNRYEATGFVKWAAKGDRYIRLRKDGMDRKVYEYVDPVSGKCEHLYTYEGKEEISFAAMDRKIVISIPMNGPKESNKDVHQILQPDDRQPGWRDRNNVAVRDIATGITTPLTAGQNNASVILSDDGRRALVTIYYEDVTMRPFSFSDGILIDLESGKRDTLYRKDGFVASAAFSPDGREILFKGSPEAFGGIGNTLKEGVVPNSFEYELFVMNLETKEMRSLTRDFDPSVSSYRWSKSDGRIYACCENVDLMSMFCIDPKTGKARKLDLNEPYLFSGWDIAGEKPVLAYCGESSTSTDRSWVMDLKTGKQKVVNDLNPTRLAGIELGECHDWSFRAERGDTIHGCYYLPPYFDKSRKYPMLVYYYGGCSPVGRYLDSYYCYQEWAALGYVVYVIQPSGCSGQGQEFASRHVNTYGDYTADDIIQGTKQFCREHEFVNAAKIGCMGASYGGFMTQYLQTKTDIFTAAMSHAGISNPASYWGYGYWGYSYSSTSAAHSYPWNNTALYSGHAPLFNADKVHTPILFMHGAIDTNVPINESIQMFNALKILGRETAFIVVEGQDHHILDYNKRIRWHDSIMAWFARWLQDDPTWWNSMYPEKNL